MVDGGRLLAERPTWFAREKRTAPLVWPIWVPTANYGVPLLAALVVATSGWSWRRRGRALAVGLALITVTQIAFVLVTIVATQQSPVMSRSGLVVVPGFSPTKQSIFYALYYFFDLTGRGFFALLIYLGLIAVGWRSPEAAPPPSRGRAVGRNDPCPCGSGKKYKHCCLA
jgi:SEC-C motif